MEFIFFVVVIVVLFIAIQKFTRKPSIREMKIRIQQHEQAIEDYKKLIKKAYYEQQQRDAENGKTF